jgi:hypothetical protein
VDEPPLRIGAGRVQVEVAVAVEIGPRARHPIGPSFDSRSPGHVVEAASFVPIQAFQSEVICHEKIGPAVAVVVGEEGGKRPARVLVQAPRGRGVPEMAVAVVEIEMVGPSVARVVGGIGHLVVVVPGDAHEKIEIPVAVHVGEGGGPGVSADG